MRHEYFDEIIKAKVRIIMKFKCLHEITNNQYPNRGIYFV